jgi:hypothetical protein
VAKFIEQRIVLDAEPAGLSVGVAIFLYLLFTKQVSFDSIMKMCGVNLSR